MFGLCGVGDAGLDTQVIGGKTVVETHEGEVKVVVKDVVGAYTCDPAAAGARPNWRILAATVTKNAATARYRLEGPAETVADWKDAFVELLKKAAP